MSVLVLGMTNYPIMTWSFSRESLDPGHMFKMGEARHFKFGIQIDTEEY